ncbi:hypothetical protein NQ318_020965 [Aromia moschata]|uniref:Uncharacterized protein n=1 Tax=Aromia moschata TaxID=1265417 RepID=A0AAV8YLJ6_9CUCU|nr:hypothetical protein NQ318_020965 [Aromia moschata]
MYADLSSKGAYFPGVNTLNILWVQNTAPKVPFSDPCNCRAVDNNETLSLDSNSSSFCESNPKKKYRFIVKLSCDDKMKEQSLQEKNKCEYVIHKMTSECSPICTAKIHGLLVDLKPLRKNYLVQSDDKKFSLTICGSNKDCKHENISTCQLTDNVNITTPISDTQTHMGFYNEEKNELSIHGSYKGQRKQVLF